LLSSLLPTSWVPRFEESVFAVIVGHGIPKGLIDDIYQVIETAPKSLLGRTRAIEHSQPMLSLHGHIHESAGAVKVGPMVAINPGSESGEGLRGVLSHWLTGRKVKGDQLVSG
jgi:Icc-related predicted phosphoesterase